MRDEGGAPLDVQMSRFRVMSSVGPSFELMVAYMPNFIDEVHRRHDMRYVYEDSTRPTQVVNVRIRVVGPSGTSYRTTREREQGEAASAAQVDTIAMYSAGQWCQAPVYDRQRLHAGNRLSGPALITEYSATTVVPAEFVAWGDPQHNRVLRPGSSPPGRG